MIEGVFDTIIVFGILVIAGGCHYILFSAERKKEQPVENYSK